MAAKSRENAQTAHPLMSLTRVKVQVPLPAGSFAMRNFGPAVTRIRGAVALQACSRQMASSGRKKHVQ